jgi:nucleoside recognition membrane protein YjiH
MSQQKRRRAGVFRFLCYSALGLCFFMLPVPVGGRITVPFDIAVGWITTRVASVVAVYCFILILIGAIGSTVAMISRSRPRWSIPFATSRPLVVARIAAVPLAVMYLFHSGPDVVLQPGVGSLMWNTLAFSVAVIIPIGAALLVLLVRYGLLDFIGTLMRPIMRPLFRLPGRSSLDSVTSWVGSYSVGLYLTRQLTHEGWYSRREAYTIATCFSTVSIGFVAVVAQTLDLLHLFPLVFLCYFMAIYSLTAVLSRTWPITSVSNDYLGTPKPEPASVAGARQLLTSAWQQAVQQAQLASGVIRALITGLSDGLVLAATILGSILTVGTAALLLARETPLFAWLGKPLVPVLALLGLPDAELISPAVLVGITEMYIPSLLVQDATTPARFFVAVLSISQLIFFSSVGPMIIDMFRDVPIRGRELVALFLIRTAILIPVLALATTLLTWAGVLR